MSIMLIALSISCGLVISGFVGFLFFIVTKPDKPLIPDQSLRIAYENMEAVHQKTEMKIALWTLFWLAVSLIIFSVFVFLQKGQ